MTEEFEQWWLEVNSMMLMNDNMENATAKTIAWSAWSAARHQERQQKEDPAIAYAKATIENL